MWTEVLLMSALHVGPLAIMLGVQIWDLRRRSRPEPRTRGRR